MKLVRFSSVRNGGADEQAEKKIPNRVGTGLVGGPRDVGQEVRACVRT